MVTHSNGFMMTHSNMLVTIGLLKHSIGKMAFSIEGAHTQRQKQNQTTCVLIQRSREPSLLYTLLQWFFSIFKHHSRYFMKHLLSAKQQQVTTGHDESCPSAGCVAHGWRWLVHLAGHHSYTAPPYSVQVNQSWMVTTAIRHRLIQFRSTNQGWSPQLYDTTLFSSVQPIIHSWESYPTESSFHFFHFIIHILFT